MRHSQKRNSIPQYQSNSIEKQIHIWNRLQILIGLSQAWYKLSSPWSAFVDLPGGKGANLWGATQHWAAASKMTAALLNWADSSSEGLEKIWMKQPAWSSSSFFPGELLISLRFVVFFLPFTQLNNCLGQTCHLCRKRKLEEKRQDFIQVWSTELPLGKKLPRKYLNMRLRWMWQQEKLLSSSRHTYIKPHVRRQGELRPWTYFWSGLNVPGPVCCGFGCDSFLSWGGISVLGQEP